MTNYSNKNYYTVSGLIGGEYRHHEYHILASSEKQARFFFSAPYSKGGRGNGFYVRDWNVTKEPGHVEPPTSYKQIKLSFGE